MFRHLGSSLDLAETLATLDRELHRLVRYDAISVHLVEDCRIAPAYAAVNVSGSFTVRFAPEAVTLAAATLIEH